jgi:hypothetical protein
MILTITAVVIGNFIYTFCFSWVAKRIMRDNVVNVSIDSKTKSKTFKERLEDKKNETLENH